MQQIISLCALYYLSGNIKEKLVYCKPLLKITKSVDVFEIITNLFFKHDFHYKAKFGSVLQAPVMIGKSSGFIAVIIKEIPDILINHCFLQRDFDNHS